MLTGAIAVLAAALLCWPHGRPVSRLRALYGLPRPTGTGLLAGEAWVAVVAAGVAVVCWLLLGLAGALAGAGFAAMAWRRWRARRQARARMAAVTETADALGGLVAELRAGTHPAVAAESVAAELTADDGEEGAAATALRAVSVAGRLGGDVHAALARCAAAGDPAMRGSIDRLARAWALAQRHGLPLAEVLDAVRRDLAAHARFESRLRATLAGPRASAAVLAGLPAFGFVLGEAMGASPGHILASTAVGQALLLIGAALVLAGLGWSARLTGRVVPP